MPTYAKLSQLPPALEHDIQCAFVSWAQWAQGRLPELGLLFAVPNGGHRHPAVAGRLKAEGVRPGVPDVWLPVPRQGHPGLTIEFKRPGERESKSQVDYRSRLQSQGWVCHVCTDWQVARDIALTYLVGSIEGYVDLTVNQTVG